MIREKYVELRKKRLKERDERLERQRKRVRVQREKELAKRLTKWAELGARRRRIEDQLENARLEQERLERARLKEEKREKARDAIESARTAVETVEKEVEASVYVPELLTKISQMLADADESSRSANYEKAMTLSYDVEELVEKARLESSRRVEEEERKRKIEEQLLLEKKLEEEIREKAKEAIGSARTAVGEAKDKTKLSIYTPRISKKIDAMLTDAEKSFDLADYEKAIKLSFGIRELVEEAKLEASRKAEEKRERRKREAKYFYCVVPFSKEKSFGNLGLNNREVYTIPYRGVAAVVSDSSMKDYELTEDHTRKHEAVLRQVMEEHTAVPVEFGTVLKDERILKRLLTKAYNPTSECLNLVDNMVELGVKTILNKDIVYVDPKKRKECVSDILISLNTGAKQAVMRELFSDRLVLNASFLVNKEEIDAFSDKVTKLQEKYPMLKLLYSGPWAPYNFVHIKVGAEGIEITKKE